MGYPATTEPPQPYSHRSFRPRARSMPRPDTAPHTVRGGVLRGPSPGLVHLFSTLPFLSFEEVLCLLHSLQQAPVSPHHRVSVLFLIPPERP